uniref:Uncharacterized protein n=1 Tax=Anopheles epiroticus TaxID=199890 RepID=A0A182PUP4_9DIPT
MNTLYSLLVLAMIGSLAVAYPAESQDTNVQQGAAPVEEPVQLVQLVPVEEQSAAAALPEPVDAEGQRSKRHLAIGVGLVGGVGFGGFPVGIGYGYPGYGYGGGFHPGYGYGGYHRYGYGYHRYGGYGYGGGFGHPYY